MFRKIASLLVAVVLICSQSVYSAAEKKAQTVEDVMNDAIVLHIGRAMAYVYNEYTLIDEGGASIKPRIKDGITYVPVRFVAESLGMKVKWDAYTETVTLSRGAVVLQMSIGINEIYVNDERIEISGASFYENGRTYVPVRVISEHLEKKVFWNKSGLIVISNFDLIDETTDPDLISQLGSTSYFPYIPRNTQTISYFVSPDGSDLNEGTKEKPFAGLEKAQKVVRERLKDNYKGHIDVILRGGNYYLSRPLVFTEEDSGYGHAKVTYKNYPDETPIISGGEHITDWEAHDENVYKSTVRRNWLFDTLSEDAERSIMAREPNTGYFKAIGARSRSSFIYNPEEVDLKKIKNLDNLQVYNWNGGDVGYWRWFTESGPATVNLSTGVVSLSRYMNYTIGTGTEYYFQGALEFLDRPGEFYHDKNTGELYYWPRGENIKETSIVAPIDGNLIHFLGKSESNRVKNIVLQGLTITTSNARSDLVRMENARNTIVDSCRLLNAGENGVRIYEHSQNNQILNCEIAYFGDTGVQIDSFGGQSDDDRRLSRSDICYNNTVKGNYIHNGGHLVGNGSGVQLQNAGYNTISSNTIHDVPRYGISIKGSFDQAKFDNLYKGKVVDGIPTTLENFHEICRATKNIIEYNDIYRALTESQDGGAVELWSVYDNILANNHVHHTSGTHHWNFGIYFDDSASHIDFVNNIVDFFQTEEDIPPEHNVTAINMFRGVRNRFINNVYANNNRAEQLFRADSTASFELYDHTLRNNIAYNSGPMLYNSLTWRDGRFSYLDDNIYYNTDGIYSLGIPIAQTLNELSVYKGGTVMFEQRTKLEDPRLADPENADYRFMPDAMAYTLGTKDVDGGEMGVSAEFPYGDLGEELERIYIKNHDFRLNGSSLRLKSGEEIDLEVYARTAKGKFVVGKEDLEVSIKSEGDACVTVDGTKISGGEKGTDVLTISASRNGITKSIPLYVFVDDSLARVTSDILQHTMILNETQRFYTEAITEFGTNVSGQVKRYFVSSNPEILEVNSLGQVTAKAVGSADIQVKTVYREQELEESFKLQVKENVLEDIRLQASDYVLLEGMTATVWAEGTLTDGQIVPLSEDVMEYKSGTEGILAIDEDNVVSMVGEGRGEVVAQARYDGRMVRSIMTIYAKNAPRNPYETFWASDYDENHGTASKRADGTKGAIGSLDGGDWLYFGTLDFGQRAPKELEVHIGVGAGYGGRVEVRLDSLDGPVIAEFVSRDTGSFNNYQPNLTQIKNDVDVTGVHSIYFRFFATGTGNMEKIKFIK